MNHQGARTPREDVFAGSDSIAKAVVDPAFNVHSKLGPGLLESVYEVCLALELSGRGLKFERQVPMPVIYDGIMLDAGLRLDFIIEGELIVELKAVETLLPVHRAQMLTYLKLAHRQLGLLINFNVPLIKDGLQRIIV